MESPKKGYTPANIVILIFFYIGAISSGVAFYLTKDPLLFLVSFGSIVGIILFRRSFITTKK